MYKIAEKAKVINDRTLGNEIYSELSDLLKETKVVEVDFDGLITMTTYCSKQIFGQLYVDLGPENFFNRLKFCNVSEDLKVIIRLGIHNIIEREGSE